MKKTKTCHLHDVFHAILFQYAQCQLMKLFSSSTCTVQTLRLCAYACNNGIAMNGTCTATEIIWHGIYHADDMN